MSEESRRENWMCRHLTFYHFMIFSSLFQKVKFRSFIDPDFVFREHKSFPYDLSHFKPQVSLNSFCTQNRRNNVEN